MTRNKATAIGFTAVLMWALLALFTIGSAPTPPFLLSAMCFGIGGVIGLVWTVRGAGLGVLAKVDWKVYAFGTLGLFGYHFFYFTAFRWGPNASTGLIAYLWPLFIVLLSGLLPGENLRKGHVLGAVIALVGAGVIVVTADGGAAGASLPALGLAFLCALTWSCYSVASRYFGAVPTESVTVFCLATAVLSLLAHLGLEQSVWPEGAMGWASVLALGLGSVGAAFFTWDMRMKQGDIQLLGVASYAAPLLSTLVLVLAGVAEATWSLALATVLITSGAALAAYASAAR
ncbi:EamA family transporter [Pseudorhodobacter turbinis]|uniref:EamA family transporter n=1 Tax=Pseudorhodobacter turbinis TaxID=2500533 RepID=A0A4P8EH72_9RHOB|nr:EamA family transporter [Pseudorhodobacter turbinis]QCO56258.1 EamA family transporter [Pseudorhodobacter turbinis]